MKTFNYLILSGILMTSTVQAADCPTAPNVGVSITTPTSDFILQGR